jgi:DNA-binding winged helix-turn-helix (wHTH) protein/TolB-like protein/tetratricopeptide (TPR) repeat protein
MANEPTAPGPRGGLRGETLLIGRWTADPRLDELRTGDSVVKLEPRKMRLLMELAKRPGELVTTEELFDTVWKDVVVTQSSVYQSIAQLRKTLGDDSDHPTYIATVPRKGYRLVAPVSLRPLAEPGPKVAEAPSLPDVEHRAASQPPARRLTWTRRAWVAAAAATGSALVAVGVIRWRGERRAPQQPVRLAVLPFADMSEPPDAAFTSGMTDELQATLERVPGLQVSARASSITLAAQGQHAVAISKRLGASHFVRGGLRRGDGRVVITAELIGQDTGDVIWSGTFERTENESLALAPEIGRAIVAALNLPFGSRGSGPSTGDFRALELYFAGMHHLRMVTPESVRTARDYFQRASELDPRLARAYAGLALAWMAGHDFEGLPLREVVRYAQPLIDKALSLEPDSAVAHATQGYVYLSTLRLKDAEDHLRRALELNPNYATAEFWRGMTAAFDGRPLDAIPIYLHAGQLDPLNFLVHLLLGLATSDIGQFQVAREHIHRAQQLAPRHPNAVRSLGAVAFAEGNTSQAVHHYREAARLNPKRYDIQREMAWLCLDAGLRHEASEAFERAIEDAPSLPYLIGERGVGGAAFDDLAVMDAAIRRLEEYEPKPLPTGAQVGLAWLHLLRGQAETAFRLADEVAGRVVADPVTLGGPWETFLGQSVHVDLAAIYASTGRQDKAEPILADVWRDLERLERNRVAWHSVPFLKARVSALRGDREAALSDLERAKARGFRRGWWLSRDPALKKVHDEPRLRTLVEELAAVSAAEREKLSQTSRPNR